MKNICYNLMLLCSILFACNHSSPKEPLLEILVHSRYDTTYDFEPFYGSLFINSRNLEYPITKVDFKMNGLPIIVEQDTGKVAFIPSIPFEFDTTIFKKFTVEAYIKMGNGLDTTLTKDVKYIVSNNTINPRSKGELKNGKRQGKWVFYKDNNNKVIRTISNYSEGLKNGVDSSFYNYKSNRLYEVSEWKTGKRNGVYRSYYSSGQLNIEGYYKDGKRDGEFRTYSSSGKLVLTETFEMGEKIE